MHASYAAQKSSTLNVSVGPQDPFFVRQDAMLEVLRQIASRANRAEFPIYSSKPNTRSTQGVAASAERRWLILLVAEERGI